MLSRIDMAVVEVLVDADGGWVPSSDIASKVGEPEAVVADSLGVLKRAGWSAQNSAAPQTFRVTETGRAAYAVHTEVAECERGGR